MNASEFLMNNLKWFEYQIKMFFPQLSFYCLAELKENPGEKIGVLRFLVT